MQIYIQLVTQMDYYVRKYILMQLENLKNKKRKWRSHKKGAQCSFIQWIELDTVVQFFLAAAGKWKQWEVQAIYLYLISQIPY